MTPRERSRPRSIRAFSPLPTDCGHAPPFPRTVRRQANAGRLDRHLHFFPKDLGHRLLVEQVADVPAIYTVLGNRKTSLSGAYHAFDFAKLAAFAHRFNRRFHLETFPGRLLVAALAIGARSERCLRRAEGVC